MSNKVKAFPNEIAELDIRNDHDILLIPQICNALASPIRVNILNQLQISPHSIPELAVMNDISVTNCVFHTSILADASLIRIELVPGETRNVRMCYRLTREVNINLFYDVSKPNQYKVYRESLSVGEYVDISNNAEIKFTDDKEFHLFDAPFSKERYNAGIIWSPRGTITYAFPNNILKNEEVHEIEINFEMCSEVVTYNNEYKSDITIWLNGIELFTHESPGDYGDRPGINNPEWYKNYKGVTQYGDYYHIVINSTGTYLNEILMNKDINIKSLNINSNLNKLLLKIGNKKDAVNEGGWNLFGKNFGDYPIDIEMNVSVSKKNKI